MKPISTRTWPQRIPTGWLRGSTPAVLTGVAVATVVMMQLFLGEDVGLANNGDGARLWCRFGIEVPQRLGLDFTLTTDSARVCVQDAAVNIYTYPTSMSLMIRPVLALFGLATSSGEFDIRYLGALGALSLAAIAALAVHVLPGRVWVKTTLVGLSFALWADIGFVSYLTSYYSDPAAIIGSAALIVVVARHARMDDHRPLDYLLVVVVSLFAITAKAQLLVLVIPTVAMLLVTPWLVGRLSWRGIVGPILTVIMLVGGAAVYSNSDGSFFADANEYNSMFFGILAESDDPEADLAEMGLPTSLAPWAGTNFFNPGGNAADHPDYKRFQQEMTRSKQARFLIRHPDRLLAMVGETIEAMPDFRVPYLGNYEGTGEGLSGTTAQAPLADRWDPMSVILQRLRPGIAVWLPVVWLLAVGLGTGAAIRKRSDPVWRSYGMIAAFTGTSAFLAMLVTPIGDGYMELPKHTFLVVWLTAPLLAGLGVAIAAAAALAIRRPREDRAVAHIGDRLD